MTAALSDEELARRLASEEDVDVRAQLLMDERAAYFLQQGLTHPEHGSGGMMGGVRRGGGGNRGEQVGKGGGRR